MDGNASTLLHIPFGKVRALPRSALWRRRGVRHVTRMEYYGDCARLALSGTVSLQYGAHRFLDPQACRSRRHHAPHATNPPRESISYIGRPRGVGNLQSSAMNSPQLRLSPLVSVLHMPYGDIDAFALVPLAWAGICTPREGTVGRPYWQHSAACCDPPDHERPCRVGCTRGVL